MKKIVAINAGPRKGWNTDRLVQAAAKGAEDSGIIVEHYDLFKLEKFTGCVSCFGCKRGESFGKCVCRDGLYDVLNAIREADGLIIGSPNYLGDLTASFRALFERLLFQSITYNKEEPCCNQHRIPVLLIMTSNIPERHYGSFGYEAMLNGYKERFEKYVGPTELFCCGNTLQVEDYSKYNWTIFDPEKKKRHHDETFGDYLTRAYELGKTFE